MRTRPLALLTALALGSGVLGAVGASPASAATGGTTLFALVGNALTELDTASVTDAPAATAITGLDDGDLLVSIDVRPATGGLYAYAINLTGGDDSIYLVDPVSHVATKVPGTLPDLEDGLTMSTDIDPVNDVMRVVSDLGNNFTVDLDNGAVVTQSTLTPSSMTVTDLAYSDAVDGTSTSTLYAIDFNKDELVTLPDPAQGGATPGLTLGLNQATSATGFDISPVDNVGYAWAQIGLAADAQYQLFSVDLTTGVSTLLGTPLPSTITDIAVDTPRVFLHGGTTVAEGGAASIGVRRTGDLSQAISVPVTISAGTATAGTDFTAGTTTVLFEAGSSEATTPVSVQALTDSVADPNETFVATLGQPTVGVSSHRPLTVTILDAAVNPVVSRLTLASTTTVTVGQPAGVIGRLTGTGGAPIAGAAVYLQWKPAVGAGSWVTFGGKLSQADGRFSTTFKPPVNAQFRAVYLGDATTLATLSATDTTKVVFYVRALRATAPGTGPRTGTISGTVDPVTDRPLVRLQWLMPNGTVRDLGISARVAANRTYVLSRRFNPGSYLLRVGAVPTAQHGGAYSRVFRFVVS